MKLRILTGLTAAAALVSLIYVGSMSLIYLVVLICSAFAYLEYDRLFFSARDKIRQCRVVLLISMTLWFMQSMEHHWTMAYWMAFIFLSIWSLVRGNHTGNLSQVMKEFSLEWLGYTYVVSLFGFLLPIVQFSAFGRDFLFLLFLVVFGGDTAAYFVGVNFGKKSLARGLSPKKTLEGALAAIVVAEVLAVFWLYAVCRCARDMDFTLKVLLFTPILSVLAQMGDLFESLLKRSQAQKDSGSFLPGHGGLLDRVDGLALAAPVFYIYLTSFLERGP